MRTALLTFSFLSISIFSVAQERMQSGFDSKEYLKILGIFAFSESDTTFSKGVPMPEGVKKIYQSPIVGLENKWYLWVDEANKTSYLNIRGTAPNPTSWLANFYSAMIPASGEMQIRSDYTFKYEFSEDPKAAVHIGWTLGTGALAETLVPKVDSLVKAGYKDFVVTGHSQGGAITYLMNAHLQNLNQSGKWGSGVRFKTYSSAAPKPGNLFFAYHYENMTAGGWAFNVVNAADWVPQVPFSIQTVNDFSTTNPFSDASRFIKKQKFPKNLVFKRVYNKLNKPSQKSKDNFQKYLGDFMGKQVTGTLPDYQSPEFFDSNHYSRAGNFIILQPDEEYKTRFPDLKEKTFQHHMLQPYLFLLKKQYPN